MLPMILRLKVSREEGRGVNLYIPLILIYILLLPFFIIAIPLAWLWYSRKVERKGSLKIIPAFLALLGALRGAEVEVSSKESEVILKLL